MPGLREHGTASHSFAGTQGSGLGYPSCIQVTSAAQEPPPLLPPAVALAMCSAAETLWFEPKVS